MTAEQREQIAAMRNSGEGYTSIAAKLNLSVNTIKTFCKRNHLGGVRAIENLSIKTGDIDLIDTGNRGNSTTTAEQDTKTKDGAAHHRPVCKVKRVFPEEADSTAIDDVLGMLMRSSQQRR